MKPVIKAGQTRTRSAFLVSLNEYSDIFTLLGLGFNRVFLHLHVSLRYRFTFMSLGNIDISGLMDALPAQHTSHQRRVNRGGLELLEEGKALLNLFVFSFAYPPTYLTAPQLYFTRIDGQFAIFPSRLVSSETPGRPSLFVCRS